MIKVTRLDGVEYYLNPHQVESIEATPDTKILMLSGKPVIVRESIEDIIARIIAYRKNIGPLGNV